MRATEVIAVLGGSFDPPHLGHVLVPPYLWARGLADRVVIAPCADHPLGKPLTRFARRLSWTKTAMATYGDRVVITDMERRLAAKHGGPSHTLRLLEALAEQFPNARVRLVVGSDIAGTPAGGGETARWHRWEDIERRFEPIVVPRAGYADIGAMLPEVSSSDVRQWLSSPGDPDARARLEAVVPAAVLDQIRAPTLATVWLAGHGHVATHAESWIESRGHATKLVGGHTLASGRVPPTEGVGGVWILTRDDAIEAVAQTLATAGLPAGIPILHAAGARRADVALAALRDRGHPVGTLHPICSLRRERLGPELAHAAFGIEGDPAAHQWARSLVGSQPWLDLSGLDATGREAYHAACSLAANHFAVIQHGAEEVLVGQGHPRAVVQRALAGLIRSSIANLLHLGIPAGVTGPVARNDYATVQRHLAALPPDAAGLYKTLSDRLDAILRR